MMSKKILFLVIALISFTNVSFASFPVAETQQTEIVESVNSELPAYRIGNSVWGILSLSCALLSIILIPNLLAIVPISLLGVIFGAIGFNKNRKGLAVTGFILSLIFLTISLVAVVVFILFGGVGAAFGG
jgi:hypothetical protein